VPCWTGANVPPAGNQVLINAMSPYINAPLDPVGARPTAWDPAKEFGDAYLYADGNILSGCQGGNPPSRW